MREKTKPDATLPDGTKEAYEPPSARLVTLRPEERLLVCCFIDKVGAPPHNCMLKGGGDKASNIS